MSRTFRRKGIERTRGGVAGSKIGGFFTTYDLGSYGTRVNGHGGTVDYRPMTNAERNDRIRDLHGESRHPNAWSPGRSYRSEWEDKTRMINKQELHRALTRVGYDAQFTEKYSRLFDKRYW